MTRGRIWLISGVPGAGKTTIARALCARYAKAIHIPVDDLRELVVSGHASPIEWSEETTRQFALARQSAARLAADYSDEGFAAVLDDVVPRRIWIRSFVIWAEDRSPRSYSFQAST